MEFPWKKSHINFEVPPWQNRNLIIQMFRDFPSKNNHPAALWWTNSLQWNITMLLMGKSMKIHYFDWAIFNSFLLVPAIGGSPFDFWHFNMGKPQQPTGLAPQTTTRWRRRARSVLNPGLQWKKWSGNGKRYEKIIENGIPKTPTYHILGANLVNIWHKIEGF